MANRATAIRSCAKALCEALNQLTPFFSFRRSRPQRQLRLCENLQLGDRRFLGVIEFGQQKFLVGGTASSLAMLAVISNNATSQSNSHEGIPTWRSVDGALIREACHG
jgi:flagellar biogenesis protein FliO